MESSQHPFKAMVSDIKPFKPAPHSAEAIAAESKPKRPKNIELSDIDISSPWSVTVDLSGINCPALLINSKLEITWQNAMAMEKIWHNAGFEHNGDAPPLLFDILFSPAFKHKVANFSKWLEFFLYQITAMLSHDQVRKQIHQMDQKQKALILSQLAQLERSDEDVISSGHIQQRLRNGEIVIYEVHGTTFKEGRLLVFESRTRDKNVDPLQGPQLVKSRLERIRRHPNPIRTLYVVLAAQLNNASSLHLEMLADEYWKFISDLSKRCLKTIEQYGGRFDKHSESGFIGFFLPEPDHSPDPMGVIECSLELKSQMIELGRQWKIRKDWHYNIELNMGLHCEEGFVGTMATAAGEVFTSFGQGMQVAKTISRLAANGQIWATKDMIDKLPPAGQAQLQFGIHQKTQRRRPHAGIREGFVRVRDLLNGEDSLRNHEESLGLLPVTQVFDLEGTNLG